MTYNMLSQKTYEIVMKLRNNKRFGIKKIKEYLDSHNLPFSEGAINGWIYHNKKPFVKSILNQVPESSEILTKEKAYILGTLCGDGWISTGYRIGLNIIDKDFADYFQHCLKKVYRIKCSNKQITRKPTNFLSTYSKQHAIVLVSKLVFQDLQRYHHNFKTKEWRVPKQILESSKETQAEFIKGFADSEACVKDRPRNREITLCSGNFEGLDDIQQMLIKTFNINSNYSIRKNGVHILTTSDYNSLNIFYNQIGFTIKRKMNKLENGLKRYKRKGIKKHSENFKQYAMHLLNYGLGHREIAKILNTNHTNIYDWEKQYK